MPRLNAELAEHAEKSLSFLLCALRGLCVECRADPLSGPHGGPDKARPTYCLEADEDVALFNAGYSLLKPVRSLVMVKLPSVRADSLM